MSLVMNCSQMKFVAIILVLRSFYFYAIFRLTNLTFRPQNGIITGSARRALSALRALSLSML